MADYDLPPPPGIRIWKGRVFQVETRYSVAGLSTSLFLDASGERIIVDCGGGTVRDMIEVERYRRETGASLSPGDLRDAGEAISAVVISHPHYDHYSGLLTLLNFMQLLGRHKPLPVVYPLGGIPIEALVDHFTDNLWEEPLFDVDLVPLEPGDAVDLGHTNVDCIASGHRHSRPGVVDGPVPALSYRFRRAGETIVYTGDRGDPGPMKEFARGSDLAIIEATFDRSVYEAEGVHLTVDQAEEIAAEAESAMFVHFTAGSYRRLVEEGILDPITPVPRE